MFKTEFANDIFNNKYALFAGQTWEQKAEDIVTDVTHNHLDSDDKALLKASINSFKFVPGGRYIYYAGRRARFYNNCLLLKGEEDTREEWGALTKRASDCLMSGAGIGISYSVFRPNGSPLGRTGGSASGPIPLMHTMNELGRNVMQGGSRRSAIYASLNWQHGDAEEFLKVKDWANQEVMPGVSFKDLKESDYNAHAPLDMTNISLNYDDDFLDQVKTGTLPETFLRNVRYAMENGEPGFSFNFGEKSNETLRNACVPYNTPILTSEGNIEIGYLVGLSINVWNGEEWSEVVPTHNGVKETLKVVLSDGRSLECSDNHEWLIEGKRKQAKDLNVGDKLDKFTMPVVEGGDKIEGDAYSQGFYSGDGTKGYKYSWVYSTKYCCEHRLVGKISQELPNSSRKTWRHGPLLSKWFVPIQAELGYCLEWLAGMLDADGCVTRDINGNGIQVASVEKGFLLDMQLMLSRLGVQCKVINADGREGLRPLPDGKGGLKEYYCRELFRLLIGNTDTHHLVHTLGLDCSRLKFTETAPQRDARRFVRVVSIEEVGLQDVYCFNEPKAHRGTFNGIVTGQCTEVTSEDDSDICNLGSVNMGSIKTIEDFRDIVRIGTMFLVCGTLEADVPYDKVRTVREKNRRLGLGLMGVHEWLLKRGYRYEMNPELEQWLQVYQEESEKAANRLCDNLGISRPIAYRAIAPTGTIGILASTTTGIEPIYAVAYKRRYLVGGSTWKYQYVIDSTAESIIQESGVDADSIECAADLASDPKRRIKFQYDVQKYVDMAISSTLNLPEWGSEGNNEDKIEDMAWYVANHAEGLRGLTFYPDGSRGGQPLTSVKYSEAKGQEGLEFEENSDSACAGGVCGV